ncbi:MAG TPA: DsbA family oxidoreductase [Candidatus Limnocylindrales bacterium]
MEIEIYADIVCPWCWIGERRLFQALSSVPEEGLSVRWRAFQLEPNARSEGTPLVEWLGNRYGGETTARRMIDRVTQVARGEDLTMNFDKAIAANTFDAHRLVWKAYEAGVQREMVEALHKAHFADGLDLGSPEVLSSIALNLGVPDIAATDEGVEDVRADLALGRELGVTGVPMFVFNGRYALSGAQDPETFREAFELLERG